MNIVKKLITISETNDQKASHKSARMENFEYFELSTKVNYIFKFSETSKRTNSLINNRLHPIFVFKKNVEVEKETKKSLIHNERGKKIKKITMLSMHNFVKKLSHKLAI